MHNPLTATFNSMKSKRSLTKTAEQNNNFVCVRKEAESTCLYIKQICPSLLYTITPEPEVSEGLSSSQLKTEF